MESLVPANNGTEAKMKTTREEITEYLFPHNVFHKQKGYVLQNILKTTTMNFQKLCARLRKMNYCLDHLPQG